MKSYESKWGLILNALVSSGQPAEKVGAKSIFAAPKTEHVLLKRYLENHDLQRERNEELLKAFTRGAPLHSV